MQQSAEMCQRFEIKCVLKIQQFVEFNRHVQVGERRQLLTHDKSDFTQVLDREDARCLFDHLTKHLFILHVLARIVRFRMSREQFLLVGFEEFICEQLVLKFVKGNFLCTGCCVLCWSEVSEPFVELFESGNWLFEVVDCCLDHWNQNKHFVQLALLFQWLFLSLHHEMKQVPHAYVIVHKTFEMVISATFQHLFHNVQRDGDMLRWPLKQIARTEGELEITHVFIV